MSGFESAIVGDQTIKVNFEGKTAEFKINVNICYTITFNSNGGTTVSAILNIPHNTIVEAPNRTMKEGIKFAGWFRDSELKYDWNFNHPVTEDMLLYAKWINLGFDYEKFKSEKAAWELLKIKNYSFDYYGLGFMSFTYRIKVENGIYKEATKDIPDDYKISIDDIYGDLEKRYLREKSRPYLEEVYLTSIDIEYDTINHIPIKIFYNNYVPYWITIDGIFNYGIENFKVE